MSIGVGGTWEVPQLKDTCGRDLEFILGALPQGLSASIGTTGNLSITPTVLDVE